MVRWTPYISWFDWSQFVCALLVEDLVVVGEGHCSLFVGLKAAVRVSPSRSRGRRISGERTPWDSRQLSLNAVFSARDHLPKLSKLLSAIDSSVSHSPTRHRQN